DKTSFEMKSLAATERVCRLSLAPKAVTEMKPLVAVPLLLIADIIGSADQMPTDRSLNRVKKLNCSRFGHQTLHRAKEKISLLAPGGRARAIYPVPPLTRLPPALRR